MEEAPEERADRNRIGRGDMRSTTSLGDSPLNSLRAGRPLASIVSLVILVTASIVGVQAAAIAAPPTNDDFDSATVVDEIPYEAIQDTSEATVAPDDPVPNCSIGGEATVWYAFTPAEDQRLVAGTFGSDYDTVIVAYTGTRGALTRVACNDDTGGDLQSRVSFDAEGGTTYYFMVSSYDLGGGLRFALERAKVRTTLRLNTSETRVYRGEVVKVTAHLDAFRNVTEKDVSIWAIPSGGSKRKIASGPIDADGDFEVRVTLGKTTKFYAEWAGDEGYLPATSSRKTVYYGVKSGAWYGSTRQGWFFEIRVEDGVKVTRLITTYRVKWDNCAGAAMVDVDLRFKPAVPIQDDRFIIRWKGPISGRVKGTFSSRSHAKGTLGSALNIPSIGCSGSIDGVGWNANNF
jgi:hypothetical protein